MTKISKGDFIEIEYTGKLTEDNIIFDTTSEKIAKESNIFNQKQKYGPAIICVGESQVPIGLDDFLNDKELNKDYKINLPAELAFGKKDTKKLKIIPMKVFLKDRIQPQVGLIVEVDGMQGIIRTVNSGRTIVDFNHPLSGRDVSYEVKILKKIEEETKKAGSILELLHIPINKIEFKEGILDVNLKVKLPKELTDELTKQITRLVKTIKEIKYVNPEEKKEAHVHGPDCDHEHTH